MRENILLYFFFFLDEIWCEEFCFLLKWKDWMIWKCIFLPLFHSFTKKKKEIKNFFFLLHSFLLQLRFLIHISILIFYVCLVSDSLFNDIFFIFAFVISNKQFLNLLINLNWKMVKKVCERQFHNISYSSLYLFFVFSFSKI